MLLFIFHADMLHKIVFGQKSLLLTRIFEDHSPVYKKSNPPISWQVKVGGSQLNSQQMLTSELHT